MDVPGYSLPFTFPEPLTHPNPNDYGLTGEWVQFIFPLRICLSFPALWTKSTRIPYATAWIQTFLYQGFLCLFQQTPNTYDCWLGVQPFTRCYECTFCLYLSVLLHGDTWITIPFSIYLVSTVFSHTLFAQCVLGQSFVFSNSLLLHGTTQSFG